MHDRYVAQTIFTNPAPEIVQRFFANINSIDASFFSHPMSQTYGKPPVTRPEVRNGTSLFYAQGLENLRDFLPGIATVLLPTAR